ncbi:hypothetical protein FO440_16075 [Mucilaginibacter corticis]|uniref:BcpO-related WXXGXW repeat protein n=1 Tax=Mucilaginibacter corticis TaxID=2597670 RepID=A0A556MHD1_9SPHI|nr:YXWGXW repeat-containing protein [Mucilaginibacter corticis]TSJ39273.1 hypothetical protein FO440_16075 [Mucilaginibacter corticis]
MKSIAKLGILLALTGSLLTSCTGQYYYVATRPVEPYYVRPVSPYANAVWVDGEWIWQGGRYAYVGGHWERPHGRRAWVRGRWVSGQRGYAWHRGYWR